MAKPTRGGATRSMTRNTIVNLVGQVVPMAIGFASIPILIRHIGMDRFGLLSLIWIVIGYFSFFDLGLGRAITKLVAEKIGDRKEEEIPPIVWNALMIMTGMSVVGSVVLMLLTPTLVVKVFKIPDPMHDETIKAFYGLSASLLLVTLTAGFRGILEARQRFDYANILHIFLGMLMFVGPLVASYWTSSLVIIVWILLFGRLLVFLAHLWLVFRLYPDLRSPARIERSTMRRLFKFATWMTVSNVISPMMVYFDKFMLVSIIEVGKLAYYTTPHEIVNRLLVVPAAMVRTVFPTFALLGVEKSRGAELIFIRCVKWLLFVIYPVILLIVYFGYEGLRIWLGEDFARNSTLVLQILSIGIFINAIAFVPSTLIQSAERPDLTAKIHLMEFPVYLPVIWYSAKTFGIVGAACAWTARVTVDMILLMVATTRLVPRVKEELGRVFIALALLLAGFVPAFFDLTPGIRALSAWLMLPFFVVLFWMFILRLEDRVMVLRRTNIEALRRGSHMLPGRTQGNAGVWAVVVTQNPGKGIISNISSYADQVDQVVIVDNGSNEEVTRSLEHMQSDRIQLIKNESNLGIAAALNRGVRLAHRDGAQWVITFDQDCRVEPDFVRRMLAVRDEANLRFDVGLIAPSSYDERTKRVFSASDGRAERWFQVKSAFISGALVRMDAFVEAGLFEEDLFIDYVDHEFTLRLLSQGFSLIQARDVLVTHRMGKLREHEFGRRKFTSTHLNAERRYYISRNRVFCYRRFFWVEPKWVIRDLIAFGKEIVKIVLVEHDKKRKLKNIALGVAHGTRLRMISRSAQLFGSPDRTRIAIVLATYEPNMDYLRQQLETIRDQTDNNWFCIITDDNSSAACQAKIRELADRILGTCSTSRTGGRSSCYLFRVNSGVKGVVSNFGDGLTDVPKDCGLVCFCDQDDLWDREKLAVLRAEFSSPRVALVHSDMKLIDGQGKEIHPSCWEFEKRDTGPSDAARLILRNPVSGCATMFRRECLEFCLPFPEQPRKPQFYHDVWIALGAHLYGEIRAVSRPLNSYRQHGGNAVGAESANPSTANRDGVARPSPWTKQKWETIWRSRASLEDAYWRRYRVWSHAEDATVAKENLKAGGYPVAQRDFPEREPPKIFSVPWDFGWHSFLLAIRATIHSPRYFKIGIVIACGKFFADMEKFAARLGWRRFNSERTQ